MNVIDRFERPNHLFGNISHRGFVLATEDTRRLRSRVRALSSVDIATVRLNKLTRSELINLILTEQFGEGSMKKYEKQCKIWDKDGIDFFCGFKTDEENQ